jgi:WD40 repeat protein
MFSGAYDYTARQWDIATGKLVATFGEHASYVLALDIMDRGKLFTGSYDGTIKEWVFVCLLI